MRRVGVDESSDSLVVLPPPRHGCRGDDYVQEWFFIEKDLLYYRDPKGHERLCVPNNKGRAGESTLRHRLVKEIHDNAMAVHLGAARTTMVR